MTTVRHTLSWLFLMKKKRRFRLRYSLYKLQQTVAITALEAKALLVLTCMLIAGIILNDIQKNRPAYGHAHYAEMDSLFMAATARLRASEADSLQLQVKSGDSLFTPVSQQDSILAFFEPTFPIDINTATQAELEKLPRIGPKMAQRILDYRAQRGGFREVEELMRVKGIGEKTYAGLHDKITIR